MKDGGMTTDQWSIEPFDPADASAVERWNRLVEQTRGSVVQRAEFVFACAALMGRSKIRQAVCRDGKTVIACALLKWRWGFPEVFVESQMPLGAWIQVPDRSVARLAGGLLKRVPFGVRLGMSQIDSRYVGRPTDSERMSTLPYIETPWLDIAGNFSDYWAARGKNLRSNMRKQRNQLQAQGLVTRMEVLTDAADMARGVRDYASLESKGWKAEMGTAVSEDHPQTHFYQAMLERFAAFGMARVYRYFFGEKLVASELCLRARGEFVILKTTYDESTAPLSPASLLRQEMFEGLFEEGAVDRVEFYGPLKEWHTRWTPCARSIYHVNLYRGPTVFWLHRHVQRLGLLRKPVQG